MRSLSARVACAAVLFLASGGFARALPVGVSDGAEIDHQPSVLLRANGQYLFSFTRVSLRAGNEDERDVYVSRSPDGLNWSIPTPVFAERGTFEGPSELVELPDGTVLLFATVRAGGIDRIRLASTSDGISWNPAATPCELGWGNTVSQRNGYPVVAADGSLILMYEVDAGPSVYVSRSTTRGVVWDLSRPLVATPGMNPKLGRAEGDVLIATFEDASDPSFVFATYSEGGPNWAVWAPPVTASSLGDDARSPNPLRLWDGSLAVYWSALPVGSPEGRRIERRVAANPAGWSRAVSEPVHDSSRDDGNPHLAIPAPGTICLAWDETVWSQGVPIDGDVYLDCAVDDRCTTAPTFAGLREAIDADDCAWSGTALAWDPVSDWGSGASGTYSVYRSENPAFVPDLSTLLEPGVTGTSFVDATAQPEVVYTYIVRARNDERCGPDDVGLADGNEIRRTLADRAVPLPTLPATNLRLTREGAQVRFAWSPSGDATASSLWRATVVRPPADWISLVPSTRMTSLLVTEPSGPLFFYAVRGVNRCGQPGP